MKCQECGAPANGNYCEYCGANLNAPKPETAVQPVKPKIYNYNYNYNYSADSRRPFGAQTGKYIDNAPADSPCPRFRPKTEVITEKSEYSFVATFLLCLLFGIFGVHRYYAGKKFTGVLWTITFGLLTFGWLSDLVVIICGEFKDKQGRKIHL